MVTQRGNRLPAKPELSEVPGCNPDAVRYEPSAHPENGRTIVMAGDTKRASTTVERDASRHPGAALLPEFSLVNARSSSRRSGHYFLFTV